jgi:hypothetical protein
MEAFLLCLLSIVLIDVCSARTYTNYDYGYGYGYSSLGAGEIAAIVVSTIVAAILLFCIIFCIIKKCGRKQRMGVLPFSTQIALAQQENQYAPPSYNQAPPYGQPPSYNQALPYGQLPSYEQPPPYSAPSAPVNMMATS